MYPASKFNELKPCLASSKKWFQLCTGLNIEKFKTNLSGTIKFEPQLKFKPWLKFFKFGLRVVFQKLNTILVTLNLPRTSFDTTRNMVSNPAETL